MDQATINRAMLGDEECAKQCTDAGVAIPCPFCGGADIEVSEGVALCADCGTWGDLYSTPEIALQMWNRRADMRGRVKEGGG